MPGLHKTAGGDRVGQGARDFFSEEPELNPNILRAKPFRGFGDDIDNGLHRLDEIAGASAAPAALRGRFGRFAMMGAVFGAGIRHTRTGLDRCRYRREVGNRGMTESVDHARDELLREILNRCFKVAHAGPYMHGPRLCLVVEAMSDPINDAFMRALAAIDDAMGLVRELRNDTATWTSKREVDTLSTSLAAPQQYAVEVALANAHPALQSESERAAMLDVINACEKTGIIDKAAASRLRAEYASP